MVVCDFDASFDWPLVGDNLQRWETEAVPLFLQALVWDDPNWTERARAVFEEALLHDFGGPKHTREVGLRFMFRHALAQLGLNVDWAGWRHCHYPYLDEHPEMGFDEYPEGVRKSEAYQQLNAWVQREIPKANAWQEARKLASGVATLTV